MSNTEKDKLKTSDIKTDEDKNVEQIYEFNPIEKEKIESKTDIKNDLMENDEIEENYEVRDPILKILMKILRSPNQKESIISFNNYLEKNNYKILFDILIFIINSFGFMLYEKSLVGCTKSENDCLSIDIIDFFLPLIPYVVYASFISGITLSFSLYGYISPMHIVYICAKYSYYYLEDHNISLMHHGYYNLMFFIILCLIILFIFSLIQFGNKYAKKGFEFTVMVVSVTVILITIFLSESYHSKSNCDQWEWGLNNTNVNKEIQNSSCNILIPQFCFMYRYSGYLDLNLFKEFKCTNNFNYKSARNNLLEFLNKNTFQNTTRFGFSNFGDVNMNKLKDSNDFNARYLSKIIDMDDKSKVSKLTEDQYPEIIVEFKGKNYANSKVILNVTYKEKLSKERKKLEKNKPVLYENVLFIFLDAVSRVHFQRKLPKTAKFFEKFMKYSKRAKYKSYQFLKYHSMGLNARSTYHNMFYSHNQANKKSPEINLIKYYKEYGYITGRIFNRCSKEIYQITNKNINGVSLENFDHENLGIFCDPNYYNRNKPNTIFRGEFSSLRRCLYGKEVHNYVLEYGKKFWNVYKDNRKFLLLGFIEGNEGTGEVIKYIDNDLSKFLYDFYKKKYLENTAVFLVSDHGLNYNGYYQKINAIDYLNERFLPSFNLLLHGYNFNEKYLVDNQYVLMTCLDIHNTLLYFITRNNKDSRYHNKGRILFNYINPSERSCQYYGWDINNCKCPASLDLID